MRSGSEVIAADALHTEGIDYHYEKALAGANGAERYPDFTAEDPATGLTVYWEHLGMLSNPAYERRCNFMRIEGVTGWLRAATIAAASGVPISTHLYPEVAPHVMRVSETMHWLEWQDWINPILKQPYDV